MKKLLSLDIGDKRIGVAISDGQVTSGYGVIDNLSFDHARREIGKICHQENISQLIIGIPKSPNTIQAEKIHKFALELKNNLNLEIKFVDETLTSKEAERELEKQNIDQKSQRYKEEIDKFAAKYILEQYLNQKDGI